MKTNILIGFPTSGKTTLGSLLEKKYKMSFIDMDQKFFQIYKIMPKDYIILNGFNKYRFLEYILLNTLLKKQYNIISTGGGIVEYQKSKNLLKNKKYNVIYLEKSYNILKKDVLNRFPCLYNEPFEILYSRRVIYYNECASFTINITDKTVENTVYEILKFIK